MNPIVTFEMKDGGIIKAELYPEIAPNTVNNFISLVKKGFYDGLIFHRVIQDFMIQGAILPVPAAAARPFGANLLRMSSRWMPATTMVLCPWQTAAPAPTAASFLWSRLSLYLPI